MACPDGELSVLIVDDPEIARINAEYLSREGPTNVIAFAMREGDFPEISPYLLGDVIISADTTAREAAISDMTFEERLSELLVHGILHLFGYDHETDTVDAARMDAKSNEILRLARIDPLPDNTP